MRKFIVASLLTAVAIQANALSNVGPFAGSMNESFESFQDYNSQVYNSLSIMGGAATLSGTNDLWVINPGAGANWSLGNNGAASAHTGSQALGLFNNAPDTVTLTFANPVSEVGAYWEACSPGSVFGPINFAFYDASGNLLGTDSQTNDNGGYLWQGWTDAGGIASMTISGNAAPVVDDMTANPMTSTPAPSAVFVFGTSAVAFLRRRIKKA